MKFLKTCISLIALITFNAHAGDPRSGPDISGVSIPLSVDKLVTTEELKQVQNKCFEEKISKQILSKFSPDRLFKTDTFTTISAQSIDSSFYLTTNISRSFTMNEPVFLSYNSEKYILTNYNVNIGSTYTKDFGSIGFSDSKQYMYITLGFGSSDMTRSQTFALTSYIPMLVFDAGKDVAVYGELGEMTTKFTVKNIRIFGKPTRNEEVYSNVTSKLTALTINTESYVECLKSEIANLP